jgi:hypothetical protein
MRLKFKHQARGSDNWDQNWRYKFAAGFTQEIYESNSLYTHIPKNASTTIRYSIAIANGVIAEGNAAWVYNNNMTFGSSLRTQVVSDYAFIFLRCPFSRLASAFLDQVVRRPHMYLVAQRKKGLIKKALDHLLAPGITFERFVLKLRDRPNFIRQNAHWIPQVHFQLFEEYDDYFCVEEMEKAVKVLKKKVDFDVIDTRSIAMHGIDRFKKVEMNNGSRVTASEISKMKAAKIIVEPRSLYTDQLREIVQEIYRGDIKLYTSKFGSANLMFPD